MKTINLKTGNDLLDVVIEAKPPLPMKDISITCFRLAQRSGQILGKPVLRVWETENFGYLWTADTLYRC